MSAPELVVIVFGLFIGYWLVLKFSGGPPKPIQEHSEPAPEVETDPPRPEGPEQTTQSDAQPLNWSEVLQIARNSDVLEIRRAYKTLMSQYHPDKVASLGPELRDICERKSKEINIAYDQAMKERGVSTS